MDSAAPSTRITFCNWLSAKPLRDEQANSTWFNTKVEISPGKYGITIEVSVARKFYLAPLALARLSPRSPFSPMVAACAGNAKTAHVEYETATRHYEHVDYPGSSIYK